MINPLQLGTQGRCPPIPLIYGTQGRIETDIEIIEKETMKYIAFWHERQEKIRMDDDELLLIIMAIHESY